MKQFIVVSVFHLTVFFQLNYGQTIAIGYDLNKNVISIHRGGQINSIVVSNNNSGEGTLRDVISSLCPDDTIRFATTLIEDTIKISGPEIIISRNLYIQGLGMNQLTVSGEYSNRIFAVDSLIHVGIEDLKLINGYYSGNGGALYNQGSLVLKNIEFEDNMEGIVPKPLTNEGTIEVQGQVIIKE